jgi:hypothetical protein
MWYLVGTVLAVLLVVVILFLARALANWFADR